VARIYWRCVAALRPLFTALGCAAALRRAGKWDAPPLEVWPAIEAAVAAEAAAEAEAEAQLDEQADLFDRAEHGAPAGGLDDEPPPPPAPPEAPPAAGPAAAPEYFPERIVVLDVSATVRATEATACSPGSFSSSSGESSCVQCAAGTYQSTGGAAACEVCLTGSYCAQGASATTSCAAGSFRGSTGGTPSLPTYRPSSHTDRHLP
jgi:hypothetical protein